MDTLDQGTLTVTDVDGRTFVVPQGGSGDAAAAAEAMLNAGEGGTSTEEPGSEEGEAASTGTEGEGAQPSGSQGGEEQSSEGGQDLIAKYLEGLDESTRSVVAERLEQFRKDADSNANRKIQDLSEKLQGFQRFTEDPDQLEPIVDLYAWLMEQPDQALPWLVERLNTDRGVPMETMRDPLMEKLGIQQPPSGGREAQPNGQQQSTSEEEDPSDKPLTRGDLERFHEEQQQKERQQEEERQRREEAAKQLNSWTQEALEKFQLTERIPEDSPMREFIFQQAHKLMQQGQIRNGRMAIETAVEQVAQYLGTQAPKGGDSSTEQDGGTPAPRTANGGTGAQVPDSFDPQDKKSRVAMAESLLAAQSSQE